MSDGVEERAKPNSPLVVDLDGTILCSDTLIEGIAAGLFQKPFLTLAGCAGAVVSVPRFKAWVFNNIDVDYDAIPANGPLVAWLRDEKARGRSIHLVSAANQGVVDRLADRFGLFDSAYGSSDTHNLKGRNKRAFILERFGPEAVYAGDARPDFHVWKGVGGAVYAGTSAGAASRLRKDGRLEAEFARPGASLAAWVRALRLHQWSKNLLLFAPLILAHAYGDMTSLTHTILAFLLLGIVASGTYLINDVSDLSSDRRHRSKRSRPLPAGIIPVAYALLAAPLLIGGGLVASWFLKPAFAIGEAAYVVLTLSYSLHFKRVALLDVFVLAGLYTLRLVMGAIAAGVAHSLWLLTFSMFFFLSLSLAKRHVEVAAARIAPGERIKGRGYFPEDWPLTLSLGVGAAAGSILILVLYLVDSAWDTGVYKSPAYLGGLPVVIAFWTARIWLLAHRGELHDDPIVFAVRDRLSWALGGALFGLLAAAVVL
ncbi:MAG: UbiA family prenyltransferase [Hyphomonadaceae bacterium]